MSELECLAYGVGNADEGICLLLRMGPHRILLDCGLNNIAPLFAKKKAAPADVVLCSHAHADHARGLLALRRTFPQLPIYASEVTTQLLPLNWLDQDFQRLPLFCQALPWRTPIEFMDGLTAELFPAGHLPGAAAILLTYQPPVPVGVAARPYTVFYTGDFFLSNSRLVVGLPLEDLRGLKPDVLIVEGSYGSARHPHRRQQENQLAERIYRAIAEQKSVLLPTAPLGLGQELLMLLRSHHLFTGQDITIWVDGAVAAGCDAYLDILPHLPLPVQNFAQHQALFWDERVRPRVRRLTPDLRANLGKSPCIVLTDEAADWQQYYGERPQDWCVLLPQEPHRLTETATGGNPPVVVETYLLAQHCDVAGTTQLIHNLRPQHVILVHGTPTYLTDLANLEELHNRYQLHTPVAGTLVDLPIGETFLQPAPPETSYEGELTELDTVVTITLPNAIAADPRWQTLADTGLIEAHWQGEELVLRGLPQRELLRPGSEVRKRDFAVGARDSTPTLRDVGLPEPGQSGQSEGKGRSTNRWNDWVDAGVPPRPSCFTCRHYRGQRCWNPASPLFEFKVTPDGYCPVFEPTQSAADLDE